MIISFSGYSFYPNLTLMLDQLQPQNGQLDLSKEQIESFIANAEKHMSIPYFDSVSRRKRNVAPGQNCKDPIEGWRPNEEDFLLDDDQTREKRSPAEPLGSSVDEMCFSHHRNDIGMIIQLGFKDNHLCCLISHNIIIGISHKLFL